MRKFRLKPLTIILIVLFIIAAGLILAIKFSLIPRKSYTLEDFGIERAVSPIDYNNNGTDDYTDILLGARADAENHPRYDDRYWEEGYPPDDIGVCTDVVWRAFKNAGYNLRYMVDNDIKARPEAYPAVTKRDSNIDFRRVRNLRVFFDEYAVSLTLDKKEIEAWQPGDIVIFGANKHIGIVSDKRNKDGCPYIVHNAGQPAREEDYLNRTMMEIVGHYRFDASRIDPSVLVPWQD